MKKNKEKSLHLQMLYRQLVDQQAAPPTLLNSGAESSLTKASVLLGPFIDQINEDYITFTDDKGSVSLR